MSDSNFLLRLMWPADGRRSVERMRVCFFLSISVACCHDVFAWLHGVAHEFLIATTRCILILLLYLTFFPSPSNWIRNTQINYACQCWCYSCRHKFGKFGDFEFDNFFLSLRFVLSVSGLIKEGYRYVCIFVCFFCQTQGPCGVRIAMSCRL